MKWKKGMGSCQVVTGMWLFYTMQNYFNYEAITLSFYKIIVSNISCSISQILLMEHTGIKYIDIYIFTYIQICIYNRCIYICVCMHTQISIHIHICYTIQEIWAVRKLSYTIVLCHYMGFSVMGPFLIINSHAAHHKLTGIIRNPS